MKTIIKIAGILLLIVFIKCSNPTNTNFTYNKPKDSLTNCDTILKGEKYIEKQIPIYKIDTSFYTFLDTIIKAEMKCPYYMQCMSGFSITTLKRPNHYYIEVNTANVYFYDYSKCYGLIEYKGVRFIGDSLCIEVLLQKTTKSLTVKYLEKGKSQSNVGPDDRYSTWYFEYWNKKIELTGKHLCFKQNDL